MRWHFLLFATFLFLLNSCRNNSEENKKQINCTGDTFEVFFRDTLNVIDCHGKQGFWIPRNDNDLKDTVFFKNDKTDQSPAGWIKSNNYALIRKSWSEE
jgi:hypothetical protein